MRRRDTRWPSSARGDDARNRGSARPPLSSVPRWRRPSAPSPSSLGLSQEARARPAGRGRRDLAGEPRGCSQRAPERGPTASGCRSRPKWIGEPPPCGGWGEPEPGGRSLQQRGEPALSGMPRLAGLDVTHTISGRAEELGSRSFRGRVEFKLGPAPEMKGMRPWELGAAVEG
jgi:hypothetical protein